MKQLSCIFQAIKSGGKIFGKGFCTCVLFVNHLFVYKVRQPYRMFRRQPNSESIIHGNFYQNPWVFFCCCYNVRLGKKILILFKPGWKIIYKHITDSSISCLGLYHTTSTEFSLVSVTPLLSFQHLLSAFIEGSTENRTMAAPSHLLQPQDRSNHALLPTSLWGLLHKAAGMLLQGHQSLQTMNWVKGWMKASLDKKHPLRIKS